MPHIVPSQVVSAIDQMFPDAAREGREQRVPTRYSNSHALQLAALIQMVDHTPTELYVIESSDYVSLITSVAAIRLALQTWPTQGGSFLLEPLPGSKLSPVAKIRTVMTKCPDEYPRADTAELAFITDSELRDVLRLDVSSANSALANREWKAATVLAGSVVEALLLWALQRRPEHEVLSAAEAVGLRTHKPLNRWGLGYYVGTAKHLGIISSTTARQCELAKDFRNLIHPGCELRTKTRCNRATALTAVAALESVAGEMLGDSE